MAHPSSVGRGIILLLMIIHLFLLLQLIRVNINNKCEIFMRSTWMVMKRSKILKIRILLKSKMKSLTKH